MEFTIRTFGNSYGIILKKKFLEKFSLKPNDVLVLDENTPGIHFTKKENKDLTHFFDSLPANRNSYGGNTTAYLENLEEPYDE